MTQRPGRQAAGSWHSSTSTGSEGMGGSGGHRSAWAPSPSQFARRAGPGLTHLLRAQTLALRRAVLGRGRAGAAVATARVLTHSVAAVGLVQALVHICGRKSTSSSNQPGVVRVPQLLSHGRRARRTHPRTPAGSRRSRSLACNSTRSRAAYSRTCPPCRSLLRTVCTRRCLRSNKCRGV